MGKTIDLSAFGSHLSRGVRIPATFKGSSRRFCSAKTKANTSFMTSMSQTWRSQSSSEPYAWNPRCMVLIIDIALDCRARCYTKVVR